MLIVGCSLVGTSAHSRDGKGNTAIVIAAGRGMVDVIQALLKYGANPEDMSNGGLFDGKTALCWAASQGMMIQWIYVLAHYLLTHSLTHINRKRESSCVIAASRCQPS